MKKFFALQLIIVTTCVTIHAVSYAQDSVKKVKAVKTAIVKPPSKTVYPHHSYKPADSAVKPAAYYRAADTSRSAKPEAPADKSLTGQYQYLLTKVYNYQQPLLGAFHKSIMDTLIQARHALRDAQGKLLVQTKTIDSLNNNAKASTESLSEANSRVNEVSLFGIPMDKSAYNLLMWGLVIVFGAVAAFVIARSGASSREAKYRTQLYNELDEEFKAYKAKANEKEKKLARDLQTERNKLDELLGKG